MSPSYKFVGEHMKRRQAMRALHLGYFATCVHIDAYASYVRSGT